VHKFARPGALIALRGLQTEPAQASHPDPGEDARDRRQRHAEHVSDLGAGEPQPPQPRDDLNASLVGAVGDPDARRAAIQQPGL